MPENVLQSLPSRVHVELRLKEHRDAVRKYTVLKRLLDQLENIKASNHSDESGAGNVTR